MKVVAYLRISAAAAVVCLLASAGEAQQSGGPKRSAPKYRTVSDRVVSQRIFSSESPASSTRVVARSANVMLEPESVGPTSIERSSEMDSEVAWNTGESGNCDGGCGGSCDSCCSSGGGCGLFGGGRRGLWYGSVDYLLQRPRFSQGAAAVVSESVVNTSVSPNTVTLTDTTIQFPFKYTSAFRASLGYRLLSCGGDIQFSYWRMTGSGQVNLGPADVEDIDPLIVGQLNVTPSTGDFFQAATGVTANIFDFDFAKSLAFGGPREPCDVCYCPRWDLRWSAGVRAADINRYSTNATSDEVGNTFTTGNIDARFVGAGPRVGLTGRRYFGPCGGLSVYAKGSQALLLGDFNQSRQLTATGNVEVATEITQQFDRFTRMIPVTDIEVGGSWQIAPYTFISAGYFFQCWWDLGMGETISNSNFGPLDTANILGFDGLFIRGELLF